MAGFKKRIFRFIKLVLLIPVLLLSVLIAIHLYLVVWTWLWVPKTPEGALERFYTLEEPEEMLTTPLVFAGKEVVPLVLKEISNEEMPRRLYAMGFLGNGSFREALPALTTILDDPDEAIDFRAEALEDVFLIDKTLALGYALKYRERPDYLGECSREIIAGEGWCVFEERLTRVQAFTNYIIIHMHTD